MSFDPSNPYTFTLTHGQEVTISGIPAGAEVTVTETCENYTVTWELDDAEITPSSSTGSSTVSFTLSSDAALNVTNDLDVAIGTGVSHSVNPFPMLLLLLLAALWFAFKRHWVEEYED